MAQPETVRVNLPQGLSQELWLWAYWAAGPQDPLCCWSCNRLNLRARTEAAAGEVLINDATFQQIGELQGLFLLNGTSKAGHRRHSNQVAR